MESTDIEIMSISGVYCVLMRDHAMLGNVGLTLRPLHYGDAQLNASPKTSSVFGIVLKITVILN